MSDDPKPPAVPPNMPPPQRPKAGAGDEAVATIIPYRNPMALAAYYMGIFSIIPFLGIFLGAAAFVCGILGLRHAARNKGAHGRAHAAIGIGCGGLFFVIYTVMAIGVAVAAVAGFSDQMVVQ
jgi:hypothetical protein